MRGGLENAFDAEEFEKDQQKKNKQKKVTLEDRVREAGL